MKNLYFIVGVDENATAEEIKKSYKTLAKKLHPDKNKSEDAEEKFKELSQAYEVLKSKETRQDYDFQRKFCQKGDENKRFQTKTSYDPRSKTRTFRFYDTPDNDKAYDSKTNSSNFGDQYRRKERNGGAKQKKNYYFNKKSNSDSSSSSSSHRSSAERSTPRSTNHMNGHRDNYEEPFEFFSRTTTTQNERTRTRESDRNSCSREDEPGNKNETFSNSTPTYSNGYSPEFPKFFETFESIINNNMKHLYRDNVFSSDSTQNNLHSNYVPSSSRNFTEEPPPQRSELFSCAFCGLGFNLEDMRVHERKCMKTRTRRKSSDPFRKAFTAEPYTEDKKTNLFFKSHSNEPDFSTCGCPKNSIKMKVHLPSCSDYKYTSSLFNHRQTDGVNFPSTSEWTPPVYTSSSSFDTDYIPEPPLVSTLLLQRINNILSRNAQLYKRKPDETNLLKFRSRCTSCQFVCSTSERFICSCYISSRLL